MLALIIVHFSLAVICYTCEIQDMNRQFLSFTVSWSNTLKINFSTLSPTIRLVPRWTHRWCCNHLERFRYLYGWMNWLLDCTIILSVRWTNKLRRDNFFRDFLFIFRRCHQGWSHSRCSNVRGFRCQTSHFDWDSHRMQLLRSDRRTRLAN